MFKYFALAIDVFLTICFQKTMDQISYIVLIPPFLHALIFYVKPHCYVSHCRPKKLYADSHIQQTPKKNNNKNKYSQNDRYTQNKQVTNFAISSPLTKIEDGSPSPTPFTVSDNKNNNSAYRENHLVQKQYQNCKQCGLIKWVRMNHCYYCNVCVHKYDHHCIFLGICIGQSNQKYYILFLWAFLISCFIQVQGYFSILQNYIWVDAKGYEHIQYQFVLITFCIIFNIGGIIVVGYLSVYHTFLVINNDTTYEMRKRPEIYYLRGIIKAHPFDQGKCNNIKTIFLARQNDPYQWQRPSPPKIGLHVEGENLFDEHKLRRRNIFEKSSSHSPKHFLAKNSTNFFRVQLS